MFDLFLAMTGGSIGVINYYYINDYARQDQWEDFSSVPVPKYQIALPQPHLLSIGRGLKPSVRVIFIYLFIYLFRNLFLSSLRAQARAYRFPTGISRRYRTAGHTRAFWENLV